MNNMTVFTKDFFDVVKPLSTMARKAAVNEENGVDTYIFEAQGARCRLHAYMKESMIRVHQLKLSGTIFHYLEKNPDLM